MTDKQLFTVLIYPAAEKDLNDIKAYFETRLNISPNKLFKKFYDQMDFLAKTPFIYPLVKDDYLKSLGYRIIPVDNFLIFYVIEENKVQIHRFLYGKRNYVTIL